MKWMFLSLLLLANVASAESPSTLPASITIYPKATPVPALKYELLPGVGAMVPGDAATAYLTAITGLNDPSTNVDADQVDELLKQPIDLFDIASAKTLVDGYQFSVFYYVDVASKRQDCTWDTSVELTQKHSPHPYLTPLRNIARMLLVQAKLRAAEGQYDDAIHTLTMDFAIVRHLRSHSSLIQGIFASQRLSELARVMAQMQERKGSPNLYWAIANLPKPMADAVSVARDERGLLDRYFPGLRGRPIEELNADELHAVMLDMPKFLAAVRQRYEVTPMELAAQMAAYYTPGKQMLANQGRSADEVEKMPAESVITIYLFSQYEDGMDEAFKWAGVPYYQAQPMLWQATSRLKMHARDNPLFELCPNLSSALHQIARADQTLARVECVEALRAYAASHDGRLPDSLAELNDTPAPADPLTGKPFGYELKGNSAILRVQDISDLAEPSESLYEITVK